MAPTNETGSNFWSVKDVLPTIPPFDGHNMPFDSFVEQLRHVETLIKASDKMTFAKFAQSKVTGPASQYLIGINCNDVEDLITALSRAYRPDIPIRQLSAQLDRITQQPYERIIDYSCRIRAISKEISTAIIAKHPPDLATLLLNDLKKDTSRSFIRGLRPELEWRIATIRPLPTFETVVTIAEGEEAELINRQMQFSAQYFTPSTPMCLPLPPHTAPPSQVPAAASFIPPLMSLPTPGYAHQPAPRTEPRPYTQALDPNTCSAGHVNALPSSCQFCNHQGHSITECHRLQSKRYCTKCRRMGHFHNECNINQELHCDNCNRRGHTVDRCRSSPRNNQGNAGPNKHLNGNIARGENAPASNANN